MNESAIAAFVARIEEARQLLAAISASLDDHLGYSPDGINWGHVGTAGHVVELLRQSAVAAGAIVDEEEGA